MDWYEILAVILAIWVLQKAEWYIKLWRWRRSRRQATATELPDHEKSRISNAAKAEKCGFCGQFTKDYVIYADGDIWCYRCDEAG